MARDQEYDCLVRQLKIPRQLYSPVDIRNLDKWFDFSKNELYNAPVLPSKIFSKLRSKTGISFETEQPINKVARAYNDANSFKYFTECLDIMHQKRPWVFNFLHMHFNKNSKFRLDLKNYYIISFPSYDIIIYKSPLSNYLLHNDPNNQIHLLHEPIVYVLFKTGEIIEILYPPENCFNIKDKNNNVYIRDILNNSEATNDKIISNHKHYDGITNTYSVECGTLEKNAGYKYTTNGYRSTQEKIIRGPNMFYYCKEFEQEKVNKVGQLIIIKNDLIRVIHNPCVKMNLGKYKYLEYWCPETDFENMYNCDKYDLQINSKNIIFNYKKHCINIPHIFNIENINIDYDKKIFKIYSDNSLNFVMFWPEDNLIISADENMTMNNLLTKKHYIYKNNYVNQGTKIIEIQKTDHIFVNYLLDGEPCETLYYNDLINPDSDFCTLSMIRKKINNINYEFNVICNDEIIYETICENINNPKNIITHFTKDKLKITCWDKDGNKIEKIGVFESVKNVFRKIKTTFTRDKKTTPNKDIELKENKITIKTLGTNAVISRKIKLPIYGWKIAKDMNTGKPCIVKLIIPEDAQCVIRADSTKCRANKVYVEKILEFNEKEIEICGAVAKSCVSEDGECIYTPKFNTCSDRWDPSDKQCSDGIHFYRNMYDLKESPYWEHYKSMNVIPERRIVRQQVPQYSQQQEQIPQIVRQQQEQIPQISNPRKYLHYEEPVPESPPPEYVFEYRGVTNINLEERLEEEILYKPKDNVRENTSEDNREDNREEIEERKENKNKNKTKNRIEEDLI